MILLIDNYDSFAHNLARYFHLLGHATRVVRNDQIDIPQIQADRPDALVISPGPCRPAQAGNALAIVKQCAPSLPILGICLGHQIIAEAFGAEVVVADEPMHGRTSVIEHDCRGLFEGVPTPLTVCRYHSLVVREASLPQALAVSARTAEGTIMGLRHSELPIVGLQFHPESILTEGGFLLLANFLRLAKLPLPDQLPTLHHERANARELPTEPGPRRPITPIPF